MEGRGSRRLEHFALAVSALLLFAAMVRVGNDGGMPIDEVHYVFAGDRYAAWLLGPRNPDPAERARERDAAWIVNSEHPPLAKVAYGLAAHALGDRLGRPRAYRVVGSALFVALAVGLYLAARRWGRAAGLGAALALVVSPRLFGHGLLATLDLPAAVACFAAALAFYSARSSPARALLAGVVLGAAFSVKLNALLLPAGFVLWAEIYRRRTQQQAYAAMMIVAPLVFVLLWPWLWSNPVGRGIEYLSFFTNQYKAPTWYFGVRYQDPPAPWHYPLIMTAATLPVGVVLLIGAGIARLLYGRLRDDLGALALITAAVQIAAVARPGQIKYDGERTFLAAFPFLLLLAGNAFGWLVETLLRLLPPGGGRARPALATALAALALFAWPMTRLIHQHPYHLNYYGGLVGGMRGALAAGLESSSWGAHVAGREVREWANANLPPGATIDTNAGSFATLNYYREAGLLRPDIRFEKDARFWFLEVCQGYAAGPWWWELYDDRAPGWKRIHQFARDGVPLLNVFERRVPTPAPAPTLPSSPTPTPPPPPG